MPALDAAGALTPVGQALLNEIRNVQSQLPYVGRWYFTNKWRGVGLPSDPAVRERMIDDLISGGLLEGYQATDDKSRSVQAVRVAEAGAERAAPGVALGDG